MNYQNCNIPNNIPIQQPITFIDASSQQASMPMDYGQPVYQENYRYTQSFFSPEVQKYMVKKSIDSHTKMREEEFRHVLEIEEMRQLFQLRINLEDRKTENALRREEGIEIRKRRRESATYSVFENSEGYLCLEIGYSDEQKEYTKSIMNCSHVRGMKIYDMELGKMRVWILTVNQLEEPIILSEGHINIKDFAKQLENNGIVLAVGRERRKMVLELVYSHLMEKSGEVMLPRSTGWNQKKDGEWIFCKNESETIKGVKGGKY